jgi:hypothetical protein
MLVSIVMRTCDRFPKPNYLGRTLDNLARSGLWNSRVNYTLDIVFSQYPGNDWRDIIGRVDSRVNLGYFFHDRDTPLTPNETAAKAISIGAGYSPDLLLFLEDDIDVVDCFLESTLSWLEDHSQPPYLLYPLGANYPDVLPSLAKGATSWKYPIEKFYGSQAYAVPRRAIQHLASWLPKHLAHSGETTPGSGHIDLSPGKFVRNHDLLLHEWAWSVDPLAKYFLTPVPSFVQHIGEESTAGNRHFIYPSWPGRGWRYEKKK